MHEIGLHGWVEDLKPYLHLTEEYIRWKWRVFEEYPLLTSIETAKIRVVRTDSTLVCGKPGCHRDIVSINALNHFDPNKGYLSVPSKYRPCVQRVDSIDRMTLDSQLRATIERLHSSQPVFE